MSIFKKNSKLQSYSKIDKDGVTNVLFADVSNVGDQYEKEDIVVAFILPSLDGQLHFSIMHLYSQVALKVKYISCIFSEETYINYCRNKLVDTANEVCKRQLNRLPDYYLFLDQDSVVHPNLFDALRESLDKHNISIVSADYIRKKGWIPVWTPVEYYTKWNGKWKFKRGDLVEVVITGGGALLVKGEVLRKLPPPWFKVLSDIKTFMGEDAYFCQLARDHGYKVYVDTAITIGHQGSIVFPQDWEQRGRKAREGKHIWDL